MFFYFSINFVSKFFQVSYFSFWQDFIFTNLNQNKNAIQFALHEIAILWRQSDVCFYFRLFILFNK